MLQKLRDIKQKKLYLAVSILLTALYIFLHLYRIDQTLFFQNDIGRDFLVLEDWRETSKPPLLGPQNSAIPFNQSSFYYYYLYPFYIFSKLSLLSTIIAGNFLYLICLMGALAISKKNKFSVLTAFYLLEISPQIIFNTRYIFNPSLVPPLVLLATFAWLEMRENFNSNLLLISAFCLAIAVGMSFLSVPILLAFLIVSIWSFPGKRIQILLFNAIGLLIVFSPTLLFELRHSFLLTKSLLSAHLPIRSLGLTNKFQNLALYQVDIYQLNYPGQNFVLSRVITIVVLTAIFLGLYKGRIDEQDRGNFRLLSVVWLISFTLTLIAPFVFNFYYILGLLTLTLVLISLLPRKILIFVVIALSLFWLRPALLNYYFQSAPRTISDLAECSIKICADQKQDPLFVSVQAGHNDHAGPEFRFLLKRANCNVKDIEENSKQANKMVVFADQSSFVHGETNFYELSLFGKSKEEKSYICNKVTSAHLLVKEKE